MLDRKLIFKIRFTKDEINELASTAKSEGYKKIGPWMRDILLSYAAISSKNVPEDKNGDTA